MANGPASIVLRYIHRLVGDLNKSKLPDRQLLKRFATQHDESAFEMLVERHSSLVMGVCQRVLQNQHDAEDAFQATFLVLIRKAGSIGRGELLANWLYGVAYRIAVRTKVENGKRHMHEARVAIAPPAGPLYEITGRELCAVLDEELNRLPERYRTPLVLCYLEGKTRDEAAGQLNWSLGTLKRRLEKGRERLRTRLVRRGFSFSGAMLAAVLCKSPASGAVPAALAAATAKAVFQFAAGNAGAPSLLSTQAAALADGAVKAMFVAKLKMGAAMLLAVGIVTGAGALAHQALTANPSAAKPDDRVQGVAQRTDQPKPAAKMQARSDRYGDALPDGALARMGTTRFRPGDRVVAVAFSPDGKILALGSDHTLRLCDVTTGKETRLFKRDLGTIETDLLGTIEAVVFSPDGKTLASGCLQDKTARLWDVASGKELRQLQGHEDGVRCLAFSPDGQTIASGSRDHTIRLWQVMTGKELRRLEGHQDVVWSIAFSPDGKTLASGGADHTLRLWQPATGREVHCCQGFEGWVPSVAFSPDGKILVSAHFDSRIRFWDPGTGKELRQLCGHNDAVVSAAFSSDGKLLVSGSHDRTIRLWEVATGKEIRRFAGAPQNGVIQVAFSPDNTIVASWAGINTVRLWETTTGKERRLFDGHQGEVMALGFSSDGRTLASWGKDNILCLWDLATGSERHEFVGERAWLDGAVFSADRRKLATYGHSGKVRLWDATTGKELRRLMEYQNRVCACTFSPDGRILASGSFDKIICLSDAATGKNLRQFPGYQTAALAFSPNGKLLALGDRDSAIRLLNVSTGKELLRFGDGQDSTSLMAFSPNGDMLASAQGYNDPTIHVWEVAMGKEAIAFQQLSTDPRWAQGVLALTFSPDGRLLASGGLDGTVYLWEVASGKILRRFEGHFGEVRALAFCTDGKVLASGSADTSVLLWDISGRTQNERVQTVRLTPQQLKALWTVLASDDAPQAHQALWTLVAAADQAVAFLEERVRPVRAVDGQRIAQLIADLDSTRFVTREKAMAELEGLGELAEPALRKVLADRPSLEVRRRIEVLLDKLRGPVTRPEMLSALRAAAVLEHIATRSLIASPPDEGEGRVRGEARKALEALAKGAPEARLTHEAKAALERLANQATKAP